uniref:Uncharacterized protein n=1 Tax=Ananas comosus var. bracteatus TaxID=296719 RepID=A0A6V7Q4Z7_ANACO|nr:unnamed protein product [Ananas comosus var. bracteatus]
MSNLAGWISALPFPHQSWPFPKRALPKTPLPKLLSLILLLSPLSSSSSSSSPSYSDLTPDEFRAARLGLVPGLASAVAPRRGSPRVLEPYEEAELLVRECDLGGGGSGAEVLAVEVGLVEDEGLGEVGGVAGAAVLAVVQLGDAGRDLAHLKIVVRVLLSGEGDESVQKI